MRATVRGLAALLFTLLSINVLAAPVDDARAKGIAYLIQTQKGDGSFSAASGLEIQSTGAALEALANAGMKSTQTYARATAWLLNTDPASIDAQARRIVALKTAGVVLTPMLDKLLPQKSRSDRAIWGAYENFDLSFPDTPLVWNAIRTAGYTYTNQLSEMGNAVYCEVLPAQRFDGGWPFVKPLASTPANVTASALLPTSYLVRELQAVRVAYGWDSNSCGISYSLVAAINNGVTYLLSKHNPADGGFGEGGVSNPLETALAYRAIQAVYPAHAVLAPAQTYLINTQQSNGAWSNALATGLVLNTFPATTLADTDKDGLPDVVEPLLFTNVGTPDSRGLINGNGQSSSGVTTARQLPAAYLSGLYSASLGASSGYALLAGSLPPGLALAPNGTISGTPTQLGTYNLQYSAASGSELVQIAVLSPAEAGADGDVPTLPEWGAILMATLLLMTVYRRRRL